MLANIRLKDLNLNYLEAHPDSDLDDFISPLALASFMGREKIVEMLIEAGDLDLDLATQ